jgi:DNA-binding beta-propeller fold protein YncE
MQLNTALSFDFDRHWEQLPAGWTHLDVPDVAIGADDDVYVCSRMDARVIVYDRAGQFVRSFGEGILSEKPHGIDVARDGTVYCVDTPAHVIRVFDRSGNHVGNIGTEGVPSDSGVDATLTDAYENCDSIRRGAPPFNLPAGVAIGLRGEFFVSDGYGNASIHHFDGQGNLLNSWGEPGVGPGQFHLPHDLCVLSDGTVVVADRENDRLQVFTQDGTFLAAWTNVLRPAGVTQGKDGLIYVAELPRRTDEPSFVHGWPSEHLMGGLAVLAIDGNVVGRFRSDGDACADDRLAEPHGIAVDSRGNIYVAGVTHTGLGRDDCHTLQRLARKAG